MRRMRTALLAMLAISATAAEFHVAASGDDVNPGTLERPFATLERARAAAREARGEPVTIWIRGGYYALAKTFALTAEDSGTPEAPVTWRAYPGETARLSGGRRVSGFAPVRDPETLARLDEAARARVIQCDLAEQGIADFGKLRPRGFGRANYASALEVFFNGVPLTLARWPNRGWARIASAPAGQLGGQFTYEGDRPARWTAAEDVWVHGYWTQDWADSHESVDWIDPSTRTIATRPPHGVYGYLAGRRWRAENLIEELDEPGEYYVDRRRGLLYLWPPSPIEGAEVVVSTLEAPLVSFNNVSDVTLRDLTLEATRADAIVINGGARVTIAGCRIRDTGNAAVRVNGGAGHTVLSCDISETGDGGIYLSGGDRAKLVPAGHTAANNHIWNFSRWDRTYRPAVSVSGVGQRVLRNLIHDAPHMAIALSGNDHLIDGNDIHSVATETYDVGAFYMGRDWTWRGNIIQYNFFHNLGDGDTNGVYLDDCASGTLVFANVFERSSRAVHLGGGRDNSILNNIFVGCRPPVKVDARAMNWASKWITGEDPTLYNRLKAMPYQQPPWSERYPQLVNILDDEPAVPKGNRIVRNVFYLGTPVELRDGTARWVDVRDNFEGDPGFTGEGDFRLRPDSPALPLGIESIPAAVTGPYPDEFRPGLPAVPVIHLQLTAPGTTEAAVKVENLGRIPAGGEIEVWVMPEGAARVTSDGKPSFSLAPGGQTTIRYKLEPAPGAENFTVGARRVGDAVTPAGVLVRVRK